MNKTPKLRFKEFSGDWEIKKLGELGEFKKTYSFSRSLEGEGNYKHIHYGDIHMNYKGIISKDKLIPSIDIPSDDNYEFIQDRDIIFADASEDRKDLGKVAVVRNIEGNILSGLHTLCFRPKEDLNSEFFLSHSLNKEYLKFMYTRGNGAKVLGISKSNLSEYKFLAPSKEEQEKIASFFSLIDDKISLQCEKVEALKDYKKGMMQKIFSRELRFKDDDGRDYPEWEERKLGDIGNFLSGGSLSKNDLSKSGVKCILYGDLFTEYTEVINDIRNYTNKKEKLVYGEYNTLLFPTSTTVDAISLICPSALMIKEKVILGGDMSVFKPMIDNVICSFLSYQINGYLKHEFSKKAQGSTIIHIYGSDLQTCRVLLPCIEEQLKITQLLYSLDKKIEKEQEKLNYLNEYKKGLLQQMFV